jgi:hypothetical protein
MTARSCRMTSWSKKPIAVIVSGSTNNSSRSDEGTHTLPIGTYPNLRSRRSRSQGSRRDLRRKELICMAITTPRKRSDVETHRGMECARCQGPTVSEVFVDWTSGGGHLSFPGQRCLLCGDITDSLILSHRATHPQPGTRNTRHPRGRSFTAVPIGTEHRDHPTGQYPQ